MAPAQARIAPLACPVRSAACAGAVRAVPSGGAAAGRGRGPRARPGPGLSGLARLAQVRACHGAALSRPVSLLRKRRSVAPPRHVSRGACPAPRYGEASHGAHPRQLFLGPVLRRDFLKKRAPGTLPSKSPTAAITCPCGSLAPESAKEAKRIAIPAGASQRTCMVPSAPHAPLLLPSLPMQALVPAVALAWHV